MHNRLTYNFIDLFAGAGGLSEGFIQAGFEAIAHVEIEKSACNTLKTRAAYHYLKSSAKFDIYISYLKGEITREKLFSQVPDEILDSIRNILEKKFSSLEVNPKLIGRSGEKYPFNFSHNNTFIDYIQADKSKTNNQLRKMIDTQYLNDKVVFNIIIDDLESDKYKSEQVILSDYAVVQPLSKFLAI